MKKTLLIILVFFLAASGRVYAGHEIMVLQSSRLKPYEEAVQGFRAAMATSIPQQGLKSIQYADIKEIVLSDEANHARLRNKIATLRPDLILAVGTNALTFLRHVHHIPIVYIMTPYPQAVTTGHKNITGIKMDVSPARQLSAFMEIIPGLKQPGLIYNPQHSDSLVKEIQAAAMEKSVSLVVEAAVDSKEVPGLLNGMTGQIDSFWMLPDLTVTTPQTLEVILLYSLENRVPVLTFSEKYLIRGATVAVTFDTRAMGEQAGAIAKQILSGAKIGDMLPFEPEKIKIIVNHRVAQKLGISIQ